MDSRTVDKKMDLKLKKNPALVIVMLICAMVLMASGSNLYAYADLGIKPGIWGTSYTLGFLVSLAIFIWCFVGLLKRRAGK
jgi:hypothetical protein